MPRVAIEESLQQIKEYLNSQGYDVVDLKQNVKPVDAVIISGQDKDVLGMQDVSVHAPVINARGLTPKEVYEELSMRF